jgi:acyl CoA:acetate/3-ketoacid CoA transferase alpha subunit/acyl CoA:acetate/3-ketoacid CoA transferase beta subunit
VPAAVGERVVPLTSIGDVVPDGSTVGLGGAWLSAHPLAAVRELLRSGRRNLHVVSLTGSLDVDLLLGAGAARRLSFCFVSLGPFGLAPCFRRAAAADAVELDEHTGHGITTALEAAGRRLDFLPFYGPVGTSLAGRYPTIASPVGGKPVQIAEALPLDVAILHAEAATADGHALLCGSGGVDLPLARAATRVVVTAERIVDRLPASGSRYLPAQEVHHVIEAPWGAHPLAAVPDYVLDWRALLEYADAAATGAGFDAWLEAELAVPEAERAARLEPQRRRVLETAAAGPAVRPAPRAVDGPVEPHERIVVELSRLLADGDFVILGSFTPMAYAATLLAKRTHAPRLDYSAYSYGATEIDWLGYLLLEAQAAATGLGPVPMTDLVGSLRFGGLVAFEPVRPAQVDGSGAINLRRLETPRGPVRLPGPAGAPEVLELHRRPAGYLPRHDRRTCVAAVDDATLRIHPPHERRDPFVLVTDLAVLEFTVEGWRVRSRHPGVSAAALEAASGFPLLRAADAPVTPDPGGDALAVLREEVDPLGVTRIETADVQDRRRLLVEIFEAEERLFIEP